MNCPLCKQREVTELAALECERQNYRLICSFCLAEALRPRRGKAWPQIEMRAPVRFYSIEEAEREAIAA